MRLTTGGKIMKGVPIQATKVPERPKRKSTPRIKNEIKDAYICLTCTEKHCRGSEHCKNKHLEEEL